MPGAAFHLQVLDLTIQALNGGSAADRAKAQLMSNHPQHARLGALGPDFLRYRPVPTAALDTFVNTQDPSTLSAADFATLVAQIYPNPEMALYGTAYRLIVPRLQQVQAIDDFLKRMSDIAAAEDEDGLKNAKADYDAIKPTIDALQGLKDEIAKMLVSGYVTVAVGEPQIQRDQPGNLKRWRTYELLRWKRTADLARNLLNQANTQNDDALRAYAYGWQSHVAAAVTGEPFINAIVGGPYRSHWWRNKWVRNHVDAWTFGRYRTPATMAGDTATPGYLDWASLGGADLQDLVKLDAGLAGADAAAAVAAGTQPPTPGFDPVGQALIAAFKDSFGPAALAAMPAELKDLDAWRSAYVGALSVLWFMTGSSVLYGKPPGAPPAGAETPPPWYGSGGQNPDPAPSGSSSSSSRTVSAILAAILAVVAIVAGSIIVGAVAVGLAIAAALNGDSIDWAKLRGDIYWLQHALFDAKEALRKQMVLGGILYPLGRDLGDPVVSDQTGVNLTKSRRLEGYPRQMDARGQTPAGKSLLPDMGYGSDPASSIMVGQPPNPQAPVAIEEPGTRPGFNPMVYADTMIDGTPLRNGGMLSDDGTFPTRDQDFGGAVANAVQLIQADAQGLVNYNLDADRGYGWKTWKPKLGTQIGDGSVVNAVEDK